jgi:hypothetical protein
MEEAPLQGVLAHVLSEMDGEDSNLQDIVISLGHRAFGPVMVLCGLFLMTPLGAIPGLPAAFGLIMLSPCSFSRGDLIHGCRIFWLRSVCLTPASPRFMVACPRGWQRWITSSSRV